MLQNTPADLDLHVTLLGKELRPFVSAKDLGVNMDATLSFDEHVTSVTFSCLSSLSQINRVKHLLDRNTLLNVINALVFSKLYYCSSVWSITTKRNINKLQNVHNFAARIITRSQKFDQIKPVHIELKWLSVESMLIYRDCILVFKCLRGLVPDYHAKKFKKRSEIHNKETWNKNKMDIPGYKTVADQRTFHCQAVSLWNSLPERLIELTKPCIIQKGTYVSFTNIIYLFFGGAYLPFLLCFILYLRAIFQVLAPGRLIFGGTYTWRGLFSEFYGM